MTAAEAAGLIGKRAMLLSDETLVFSVVIRDVKQSYGRTRFLVSPEAGAGERWADESKVKFYEGDM